MTQTKTKLFFNADLLLVDGFGQAGSKEGLLWILTVSDACLCVGLRTGNHLWHPTNEEGY